MTIESEDILDVGLYLIQVQGRVVENPDVFTPVFLTRMSFFNLDLKNGCFEDVIEPVTYGIPKNTQYIIGTDNTEEIIFEWVQLIEGCPMELDFAIIDSITGQDRAMTT